MDMVNALQCDQTALRTPQYTENTTNKQKTHRTNTHTPKNKTKQKS